MYIEHPLFVDLLPGHCMQRCAPHKHPKPYGSFALRAGQALSLRPKVAAVLRVV
jgi:hypothetical protein